MAQQPTRLEQKLRAPALAGEQHVIPGAEEVSDAEVAKRKAREPLKPKVGQKPTKACLAMRQARPILSTSPESQPPPSQATAMMPS